MGAGTNNATASYVDWEEVVVSNEKGRRKVHYYLKLSGGAGGRDLVVVGKDDCAGHMTYHYKIKDNKLLLSILNGSTRLKLRSRKEVIDWLNSILSGGKTNKSCRLSGGGVKRNLDDDIIENVLKHKSGQYGAEFTWLGPSWTCRKRRMHYQSFCRNGAVISVQEFVYVLAEESKQLVAYLDDMYEDTRGNKMVVVRWFHKIDEVGFDLPHIYNDREIFFSLCLQDLNIECIDGLATVLSPEHYEKFTNEATRMGLMPFVCCKLFDSDDVKPYDITRMKGYWKQEIFRNRPSQLELSSDSLKSKVCASETAGFRPNKRIRWSKEGDLNSKSPVKGGSVETSLQVRSGTSLVCKLSGKKRCSKEGCSSASLSGQDDAIQKSRQYLTVGSEVEVLSQDSGIRGCWFSAVIMKKQKDKVKVQYKDVKDALDDSKYLEEWILASRVAAPDAFGIRLTGRTVVRPNPSSQKDIVSGVVSVGSVVDALWHDGWWEGIVLKKESDNRLNVYFPAEKREFVFSPDDLRLSKEWINNGWQDFKQRPDLVSAFYGANKKSNLNKDDLPSVGRDHAEDATPRLVVKIGGSKLRNDNKVQEEFQVVRDLSKDCLLAGLRWKSSGKRRRSRSPVHSSSSETGLLTFEKFFVNSSLKLDSDNCKYASASDSHFNSSVVPRLTNLVMSR